MHRVVGAALVAGAVLVGGGPRAAHACVCSGPLELHVYPPDGATGVPINTRVLVVTPDAESIGLREAGSGIAIDAAVTAWDHVFAEWHESWRVLAPAQPLAPLTAYLIERDGAPLATFATGEPTRRRRISRFRSLIDR